MHFYGLTILFYFLKLSAGKGHIYIYLNFIRAFLESIQINLRQSSTISTAKKRITDDKKRTLKAGSHQWELLILTQ